MSALRARVQMNGCNYRMTGTMRAVLATVVDAESPAWGFSICEATGRGSGVVYPVLERLTDAGLIHGEWEDPAPDARPRRRFYYPVFDRSWYRLNGLLAEDPS